MEKKDKLLLINDCNILNKYTSYSGNSNYTINIEHLEDHTTHNLIKIIKNYSKFAISEKTGKPVFGLINKQLSFPNIIKNDGIEIGKITSAEREFIGEDVDKIYDYIDHKYFENNDDYKVYDVKKDMLMVYLNIFEKVCYDKNNQFLWGKLMKKLNGDEFYFIETKNLLEIDNKRGIKIQNFLEEDENNCENT